MSGVFGPTRRLVGSGISCYPQDMPANTSPTVSLLYPPGAVVPASPPVGVPSADDLALGPIVAALDADSRQPAFVARVLAELNSDPATIVYRQQVLADLLRLPELAAALRQTLPLLRGLGEGPRRGWGDEPGLLQVAARLNELDVYVSCVEGVFAALDAVAGHLSAEGLLQLHAAARAARSQADYQQLAAALPDLRRQLEQLGSVTLGINLDAQFRPESATILAFGGGRFAARAGLLERLLGTRAAEETTRGLGTLYRVQSDRAYTAEHSLFRELNALIEHALVPVTRALEHYRQLSGGWLGAVAPELGFFLGATRLFAELAALGLPLCRPEVAPTGERACRITASYSLDLALRLRAPQGAALAGAIVTNEVSFDEAPILLITGPNSGGKTTYTRAIGQAQVLFQAGLLVPGQSARISPVDGIFSHFATAEKPEQAGGRLEEELARLQTIFAAVGPSSLLLINEPFTSTDHAAAGLLARDLLAGLKLLGARAVYVTHLHALVEDALPDGDCADGVISLVAEAAELPGNGAEPAPTYRVSRGRPRPLGYARALAQRYGLSQEQIAAQLRARGVVRK